MSLIAYWALALGVLLISMTLIGSAVERLPVSAAMLYLAVGYALGVAAPQLAALDPLENTALIEVAAEIAVTISLFAVGLRLRAPLAKALWRVPLRLALLAMLLTIAPLVIIQQMLFDMPFALALILAAVLAPTDPVLASEVQIERPGDRDQVRFGLTAEGGLNDGFAMPVVLVGLGLYSEHEPGEFGLRWLLVDTLWLCAAGLGLGWLAGASIGRLIIRLRSRHRLAVGFEEFLALGLIAVAFGAAAVLHGSGFLAVFAAGLALRHYERRTSTAAGVSHEQVGIEDTAAATDPERGPAQMTRALLAFNDQAERICVFALVMLVGWLLAHVTPDWRALLLAGVLLCAVRPLAVGVALAGVGVSAAQRRLIGWFGIRGIGTLYYLAYAVRNGVEAAQARQLLAIALTVIAASIVVHGISATPLMKRYRQWHPKSARPGS